MGSSGVDFESRLGRYNGEGRDEVRESTRDKEGLRTFHGLAVPANARFGEGVEGWGCSSAG